MFSNPHFEYGKKLAEMSATYSPDPSTKVGAVVLDQHGNVKGRGFNRFPPAIPHDWYNDRDKKLRCVIHAEMAAIVQAGTHTRGSMMFCTAHPCRECAKLIVEAGVGILYSPEGPWRIDPEVEASVRDAAELLAYAGVSFGGWPDAP